MPIPLGSHHMVLRMGDLTSKNSTGRCMYLEAETMLLTNPRIQLQWDTFLQCVTVPAHGDPYWPRTLTSAQNAWMVSLPLFCTHTCNQKILHPIITCHFVRTEHMELDIYRQTGTDAFGLSLVLWQAPQISLSWCSLELSGLKLASWLFLWAFSGTFSQQCSPLTFNFSNAAMKRGAISSREWGILSSQHE